MNKPPFNPSQPFQSADQKPAFNPSQPFSLATEDRGYIGNSIQDVKDLGSGLKRMAMGVVDFPADVGRTGREMFQGKSFNDTPIGQDYQNVVQAVPHLTWESQNQNGDKQFPVRVSPGSIFQQYGDIAAAPLKAVPNKFIPGMTPEQQADLPNPFREHPVNTALALAPVVKPIFGAARALPAIDEGLNAIGTGIRENITAPLARRALGKFPTKTPQLIRQANEAGLNAVDNGIITNPITHPFSSGKAAMAERAGSILDREGSAIGKFLRSQGESMDVNRVLSELDDVKSRFPDDPAIARKVENAKAIISRTARRDSTLPGPVSNFEFEPANKLKGFLQKKVNYKTDAATQDVGKAIAGQYRDSIDAQLDELAAKIGNQKGAENFQTSKKLFASTSKAKKALDEELGRGSRNMPLSIPSIGVGLTSAMFEAMNGGGIVGGLKAIGTAIGAELVKRHGSAVGATMSNNLSKLFLSNPQKYSSLIGSALKSGSATLPAIEQQLKQDPDFSQIINIPQKPKPIFKKAG